MFLNAYTSEQVVKDRNGLAQKIYEKFYLALYITYNLNSTLGRPLEYKNLGKFWYSILIILHIYIFLNSNIFY